MTPHLSLLATDGYKFSMAESGAPLRTETFYYSHRKGGWQYVPLDIEAFVKGLLPTVSEETFAYLDTHGYFLGAGSRAAFAMKDKVTVKALPKGSWFYNREPVFSVTGPSAIISWLEPMVLQINRRIQIATCALLHPEKLKEMVGNATCEEEKRITEETLVSLNLPCPEIIVREQDYYDAVYARAKRMVEIVNDPNRLFEVGLRACSCMEQHLIALRAIRDAGILRTSNVYGAHILGMIPVGTMGHEHIQRHGSSYGAFVAARDRLPGFISYLPDTYSTLFEGVPAAIRAMQQEPDRNAGIRFDSEHGIRGHFTSTVCMCREGSVEPNLTLESGWDDVKTIEFETLGEVLGWPKHRQSYGLGNFFVMPPWAHFGRDTVAAVFKLSFSNIARMKMGDEPGGAKESIPGKPIVWRPHLGMANYTGPISYIAQEGENWQPPVPASLLSGFRPNDGDTGPLRFSPNDIKDFTLRRSTEVALSPETQRIRAECFRLRAEAISKSS